MQLMTYEYHDGQTNQAQSEIGLLLPDGRILRLRVAHEALTGNSKSMPEVLPCQVRAFHINAAPIR